MLENMVILQFQRVDRPQPKILQKIYTFELINDFSKHIFYQRNINIDTNE
jgi:hypothetical protein